MTPSRCRFPSSSRKPRGSVKGNSVCTGYFLLTKPSWAISSVSIATSLPVELKLGPVHLVGQASRKFHRAFSFLPSSSSSTIDPFLRWMFPVLACLYQFHRSWSSDIPRFRLMLEYLLSPGSLRAVGPSVPSRYSIGSWEASSPEHSRKPARVMPSISTLKLKERKGSLRFPVAMFESPWSIDLSLSRSGQADAAGAVDDADDDEFVGHRRFQTDHGDDLARLPHRGRVGRAVALDEKGFRCGPALESAGPEQPFEVGGELTGDAVPQPRAVRLERGARQVRLDPASRGQEQPPDVDVGPGGRAREGARSPDPDAAAGEGTQGVDPFRVEPGLVSAGEVHRKVDDALQDFVGGRLVHAARLIATRHHSRDVAAGRNKLRRAGRPQPGMVESSVLAGAARVEPLALGEDLAQSGFRRGVEQRETIPLRVAMVENRGLHPQSLINALRRRVEVRRTDQIEALLRRERREPGVQSRLGIRVERGCERHHQAFGAAVQEEAFYRRREKAPGRRRTEEVGES